MYETIDDMKKANAALGHSWFSTDTADYHGSIIESDVIGGFYFVESSWSVLGDDTSPRVYRAAACSPAGVVSYLSGGDRFPSAAAARDYIATIVDKR